MKIKLDENLGVAPVELIRKFGYSADRVFEEGLSGISDQELWQFVRAQGMFLITLEKDFSDIRIYHQQRHPGVLLLRPKSKGSRAVLRTPTGLLNKQNLDSFSGHLVVVDESKIRVRKFQW